MSSFVYLIDIDLASSKKQKLILELWVRSIGFGYLMVALT